MTERCVIVKSAKDTVEELALVQQGRCTFAVIEVPTVKSCTPGIGHHYALYVSTKEKGLIFEQLKGWNVLLLQGTNNGINRFGLHCSKETFIQQLEAIYGVGHVEWIE